MRNGEYTRKKKEQQQQSASVVQTTQIIEQQIDFQIGELQLI